MKYYSEKTRAFYNTAEECQCAEFELKEKENLAKIQKEREERELKEKKEKDLKEREAAVAKLDELRKASINARKAYGAALEEFCEKYGSYRYDASADDAPTLFDFIRTFL